VGFYVHLDEQNPHIHCTLLPIDGNGKFSFKDIFAGEDKYEFKRRTMQLHEELARVNAKWGLERGDSISESGAKHRSTEEYRRSLSRECTSLEEEIERNREVLSGYRSEIHSAEIRVRSLRTMIANLEDKCAALQAEMNDVRSQLESGRGDESAMRRRLAGLESQLANVQSKLDDKRAKLVEAERLLEDLNERMDEARMTAETLTESSAKSAREMQLAIRDKVLAAMFESCLGDFRERLPELSPEARSLFDGSLLMEASERINGIVTCAMLLFVHAVDEATTFAEGHGGGGGGNDSGWGRDPDEDDILWARRCMRKACMMMQPASGYKRRR
jgi:predicted  nucleic acid-binding Zn-ribbon protein